MIESRVVDTIIDFIGSPIGPAILLTLGAVIEAVVGRRIRRPDWLTGLALFFVAGAGALWLGLRAQPVVPVYSRPWQPLLQDGANLLWVGDGWNWYVSGLTLLLGGLGILLELNHHAGATQRTFDRRTHLHLALHLGVLAGALLFVGSGNLLTVVLMWVLLDFLILVRSAMRYDSVTRSQPESAADDGRRRLRLRYSQRKGLSLLGALLLLFSLLPAGPAGPGQPLQGGVLPVETVALLLLAAAIRAGVYPFHLWLMPAEQHEVYLAERLLEHMIPMLTGLWLMGWAMDFGGEFILLHIEVLGLIVLALLGSAYTAWRAPDQPAYSTYVLITSAGVAVLAGALSLQSGPNALIWPTTVFALGGALWLVGGQVWRYMGWQLPVSVGALALAGLPFTPGFLVQPALARLLVAQGLFLLLFLLYVAAQSMLIATMLRSWEGGHRPVDEEIGNGDLARLMVSALALGLPLAVAGFLPGSIAAWASLTNAIPVMLGRLASVVAPWPVWITLSLPLALGLLLLWARPRLWPHADEGIPADYALTSLDWLFDLSWWGVSQISSIWGRTTRLLEGAGAMGWGLVLLLILYLLQ